jgi:hypothetical protein
MVENPKHCFFCGETNVNNENWCPGCEHYICSNCNKFNVPNIHLVEEHAGTE